MITKINRTEYTEVFRDKGIDCVVSPKELCTNDIVRYVRAMGNRTGGAVVALHGLWTKKRRRWNSGRRKASGAWAKSFLILS